MKVVRTIVLALLALALSSCLSAAATTVGVAVGATVAVAKVPFKVAGAAVDVAVPDGGECEKDVRDECDDD